MEIIQGGRQQGKTTTLLKMLEQNEDAVMVCVDMREVDRVHGVIEREGYRIDPNRIISASQSTWGAHRGGPVYIDNLDLVLRTLLGDVRAATTTDPMIRVPLSREISKAALRQKFEFRTFSDAFGAQRASATCVQCGAMTSVDRGHPIEGQPPEPAVHAWARQHRCPPETPSAPEEGA